MLAVFTFGLSLSSKAEADKLEKPIKEKLINISKATSYSRQEAGEFGDDSEGHFEFRDPWYAKEIFFTSLNNDMKIKDGEYLAANSTHFTNASDDDAKLNTVAFDYKTTNTVSTTTTHSLDVGVESKMEMKFPIASSTVTLSAKYGYHTGTTNTSSEEMIWKVPSQTVAVKAHHKVRVDWLLKRGTATGSVKLQDKISALIPYKKVGSMYSALPLGDII